MTDTLITILVVLFAGEQIHVTYDSRSACGDALLAIAQSDIRHDTKAAFCLPTYAPSVSLRPVARP